MLFCETTPNPATARTVRHGIHVPTFSLCALILLPIVPNADRASETWIDNLSPIEAADWNYDRAAHLLERAGFGGTPAEIERLAAMSPRQAVDRLVDYESIDNSHLEPFVESGVFDAAMDPFPKSRANAVRQARANGEAMGVRVKTDGSRRLQPVVNKFFYGLRANALENRRAALWWANRMLTTRRPLQEKMALFWHGHFATSDIKVRDYRKMTIQLNLFHRQATGNFRDLLVGITKDPAMLTYLDNAENVKEHPNENFGRELMELFSMGVGAYTERDIREAARAFTGWTDDRLKFVVRSELHDDGVKTVLGRTGNFDGEDVIDIILKQTATAEFIAGKVYRFFVREELSPEVQQRLAAMLRDGNYEFKPFLKTLFLSKDFHSDLSVGTKIKSPIHLALSTYKKLGLGEIPTIPGFNSATASLGQSLFYPPNVAGWSSGRTWITPASLLERGNFSMRLLFPRVEGFTPPDRTMPSLYAQVGRKLERGLNITQATMSGESAFNMMADADEGFNTRYGSYMGYVMAYEVVKLIPRAPAKINLREMIRKAGAESPAEIVNHFIHRFLRVPLGHDDREVLVDFLESRVAEAKTNPDAPSEEDSLRALLHLVMSAAEYQLS